MKIEGEFTFEAPVAVVWAALLDPEVLAATLPGCKSLELEGSRYTGEINVKVGPVQGKFQAVIDLEDVRELEGYRLKVDGRGKAGFVKADSTVELSARDGSTVMKYEADASVGGKLASVGQRLIEASARAVIAQSLESLHVNIKALAAAQAEGGDDDAKEVDLQQIDEKTLAEAVGREVTKELFPKSVMYAAGVLALVAVAYGFYLLSR